MSFRRANSRFMTAEEINADPVERLAAHLYETEPGPPGPADPPYGSDQTPAVERRRYRAKALCMLAADEMFQALEPFAAWAAAFKAEVSTLHADADPLHKALRLGPDLAPLTIGDMRRAHTALARARGEKP